MIQFEAKADKNEDIYISHKVTALYILYYNYYLQKLITVTDRNQLSL